jgi:hypothetical protein
VVRSNHKLSDVYSVSVLCSGNVDHNTGTPPDSLKSNPQNLFSYNRGLLKCITVRRLSNDLSHQHKHTRSFSLWNFCKMSWWAIKAEYKPAKRSNRPDYRTLSPERKRVQVGTRGSPTCGRRHCKGETASGVLRDCEALAELIPSLGAETDDYCYSLPNETLHFKRGTFSALKIMGLHKGSMRWLRCKGSLRAQPTSFCSFVRSFIQAAWYKIFLSSQLLLINTLILWNRLVANFSTFFQ